MNLTELTEPRENTKAELFRTRRAIVWGRNDLFSQAIGQILESGMTWDVMMIPSNFAFEVLLQETTTFEPEVVILCQEKIVDESALPLALIEKHPEVRVISIGLVSNLIQVYSKRDVVLQSVPEFLSIVDGSYFVERKNNEEVEPGNSKNVCNSSTLKAI